MLFDKINYCRKRKANIRILMTSYKLTNKRSVNFQMYPIHLQSLNRVVLRRMYSFLKIVTYLMQKLSFTLSIRTFRIIYTNFRTNFLKIKFNQFKIQMYTQLRTIHKIISKAKTISIQISQHLRNHRTRVSRQDSTKTDSK